MDKNELAKFIRKKLKEHKKARDCDGFLVCAVEDQRSMQIAPKGRWLGSEKERQEAIKEKEIMDEQIRCEFCDVCEELLKNLKEK